ncbi:uncharacterized protein LOC129594983 [Paramacrobiotus metropolitanus]|uniref:uncharacterized protein LOC129594983 n=1 Tax=Paramacrobiotus metropolitanus TaxID=2943436 RepID=UPI002446277A|nr:uncharacterized protein LOC129594983 [Paramacrobiotus metropolitanus]
MYSAIAVLLAVAGYAAASPVAVGTCDPSQFMPCVMPMLMFAMGPEGQQLTKIKDGMDITEPQLKSLCRIGKETLTCAKTAVGSCVPRDVTDLHEALASTVKLMEVCDRPDMYSKARVLFQCAKTLNQTAGTKTRSCANRAARTSVDKVKAKGSSSDPLEEWRNGEAMKQLCCNLKSVKSCSGTEVADKCGSQAQQITDSIYATVLESFKCNGPRGQNCPTLPPPTAEDAKFDMPDMGNMFPGMGGPGGPGGPGFGPGGPPM